MARIAWITLLALALARVAASLVPGTWAWGIASLSDEPRAAWALWAVALLLLVPPVGRRTAGLLGALGDALTARGASGATTVALCALAFAAVVVLLPDRGFFVGDLIARLGTARKGVAYSSMFPQALPLDVWLHERFVAFVSARTGADAFAIERAIGGARAAAFTCCGAALARAMDRRGAAASLLVLGTTCTGALALCTGYGKGLADLCLVAAAVAVLAVRVARGKTGLVALGWAVAAGIGLHRSGFLFLAPWAVALAASHRLTRFDAANLRRALALSPPILAGALILPRAFQLLGGFDLSHLLPEGAGGPGPLALALDPVHLADAAGAVIWVAPLAVLALVLALMRPLALARRPEASVLAALVAPWLAVVLFVHPRQGMVRDWDVFAAAGVAIACAAAAIAAEAIGAVPVRRWLAPAIAMAAIAPVGSLMLRAHDADRSLAFAQHVLDGPPLRGVTERASLHNYRSIVLARDGRLAESALAAKQAAELVPSPSQIAIWLTSATLAHDPSMIRDAAALLVARQPTPAQLILLGRSEIALGHLRAGREAVYRAFAMAPNDTAFANWARSLGPVQRAAARVSPAPAQERP